MPYAPPRACAQQGCPYITTDRYCDEHLAEARRRQDADRGTATQRGYGARHRRLRLLCLAEEPICRRCRAGGRVVPSTDMDHIDGDARNLTRENLQGLCRACHSAKTARENGGFGNSLGRGGAV